MNERNKTILQSNSLTTARFEYTALERNIFYMVLKDISETPKERYYVSISDIQNLMNVKNLYSEITRACENIISRVYHIKKEDGRILLFSMFSSCEIIPGTGVIEIAFDEKIRPYLFNLKDNFTLMELEVAIGMKSKYSKRLYEILSQWQDIGEKTFGILELKEMLALYDPKKKVESYKMWTSFESRVLKVAQREFKSKNSNLTFTYKPNKKGRKYESITFKLENKSYQKMLDFKDEDVGLFDRLVNKFKLRPDQAKKVISSNTPSEINKALYRIKLESKSNIGAYSAKIFNV